MACELTTPGVGDPTAVPDLLAQINTPFDTSIADGAYDDELDVQRDKRIFGNTLKAPTLPQQKIEAWISSSALNRITNLGMPASIKI